MAEKRLNTRVINKHDFEAHWNQAKNFYPEKGEIIVYDCEVDFEGNIIAPLPEGRTAPYAYERFKIGDGIHTPEFLPFSSVRSTDDLIAGVETWVMCAGDAINLVDPLAPTLIENSAGGYTAVIG